MSDLHCAYDKATVHPPIQPDKVGFGSPSDHKIAIARPNTNKACRTGFSLVVKRTRRVATASAIAMLGVFLACFDWIGLHALGSVHSKLEYMEQVLFNAQEVYCPIEEINVRLNSKFRVTAKLAHLSHLKSREFKKHRYSTRYKELKKLCKEEIRVYTRKRIDEAVKDGNGSSSWLSRLEDLLDPDGCLSKDAGVLPEHKEAGLSRQEQSDDYAKFISRIIRDYVSLTIAKLPS